MIKDLTREQYEIAEKDALNHIVTTYGNKKYRIINLSASQIFELAAELSIKIVEGRKINAMSRWVETKHGMYRLDIGE